MMFKFHKWNEIGLKSISLKKLDPNELYILFQQHHLLSTYLESSRICQMRAKFGCIPFINITVLYSSRIFLVLPEKW